MPSANEVAARLRVFEDEVKKRVMSLKNQNDALKAENATVARRLRELEDRDVNVENLAGKRIPYKYQINIEVPQNTSSILNGTVTLSRDGPFIARRLYASFRVKSVPDGGTADWVGRYLPLTSRSSFPWMNYWHLTGTECYDPPFDFEWGYSDGGSDRNRQDKYISGDVLARCDQDGYIMVDEIFAAGTTITFTISPLRPVGAAAPWTGDTGVENFEFQATFDGYKIVQPLAL